MVVGGGVEVWRKKEGGREGWEGDDINEHHNACDSYFSLTYYIWAGGIAELYDTMIPFFLHVLSIFI